MARLTIVPPPGANPPGGAVIERCWYTRPDGEGAVPPGAMPAQPMKIVCRRLGSVVAVGWYRRLNRGAPAPQCPSNPYQNDKPSMFETGCPSNPLKSATPAAKVAVEVIFWKYRA